MTPTNCRSRRTNLRSDQSFRVLIRLHARINSRTANLLPSGETVLADISAKKSTWRILNPLIFSLYPRSLRATMTGYRPLLLCLALLLGGAAFEPVAAQLGFDLKIDKPEPYDTRVLRAEKSGDKKLKAHKRFFQNITTHYNYYFNASNKLNEVVDGAKENFKDDYTTLLPFYNYTFDATAQNT